MGTPDFAVPSLKRLIEEYGVEAVFTQPDKPKGRGKKMAFSPVKEIAVKHDIKVFQPLKLKEDREAIEYLKDLKPDFIIVVAYGQILTKEVLDIPVYGCINLHASLLPMYRGAAPLNWVIVNGEKKSGNTTMLMDVGLDTGDMLHKVYCDIDDQETSASLYHKLAEIAPSALIDVLDHLEEGKFIAEKQDDSQSNYAEKLSKEEAKLDWSLSAAQLERNIRAFNPWPISFLQLTDEQGNEQTLKVYAATVLPHVDKPAGTILSVDKKGIQIATKEGVLNLLQLQPAGKKPMSVQDFLNGRADWFQVGKVLN